MIAKVGGAIFLLFILFAVAWTPLSQGFQKARTDNVTQNFVVTTTGANTTANVTLGRTLFLDQTDKVGSITSNATETPAVLSYDAASQKLLVANLNAATTRLLTVNYAADTTDQTLYTLGPFLGLFVVLLILGVIGWDLFTKKKGRR